MWIWFVFGFCALCGDCDQGKMVMSAFLINGCCKFMIQVVFFTIE